ncbi:MAG: hypothetical protein J7496_10125 [Novosphingobium sp.]|nr:hypothetical protein [Novosphingobium sp.]
MNFIIKDDEYDSVIKIINESKKFLLSNEYKIIKGNGEDLPGVMSAAFTRYLINGIKSGILDKSKFSNDFNIINQISEIKSEKIIHVFYDEIFPQEEFSLILDIMNDKVKDLYRNWLGSC